MYSQQRGTRAPQMSQGQVSQPQGGERRADLSQHYKPVAIGAITAAALCTSPRRDGKASEQAPQRR
jgi:hypothetical protein